MHGRRSLCVLMALVASAALPGTARAQEDISIAIEKHARLTVDGGVVFVVTVACGPLPGTEDFREGLAGALQLKTGAEGEGGLSPDVICDGVQRVYTAALSPIADEAFRRGPAGASVSVIACNSVGLDQICQQASAQRRIVISGPLLG